MPKLKLLRSRYAPTSPATILLSLAGAVLLIGVIANESSRPGGLTNFSTRIETESTGESADERRYLASPGLAKEYAIDRASLHKPVPYVEEDADPGQEALDLIQEYSDNAELVPESVITAARESEASELAEVDCSDYAGVSGWFLRLKNKLETTCLHLTLYQTQELVTFVCIAQILLVLNMPLLLLSGQRRLILDRLKSMHKDDTSEVKPFLSPTTLDVSLPEAWTILKDVADRLAIKIADKRWAYWEIAEFDEEHHRIKAALWYSPVTLKRHHNEIYPRKIDLRILLDAKGASTLLELAFAPSSPMDNACAKEIAEQTQAQLSQRIVAMHEHKRSLERMFEPVPDHYGDAGTWFATTTSIELRP